MKVGKLKASFQGMANLPLARQLGLLFGLTASIILAIYIVLWSRTLGYPFHLTASTQTTAAISPVPGQAAAIGVTAGDRGHAADTHVSSAPAGMSGSAISVEDKLRIWDVSSQILGGFIAVLVLLGVLRPVMRYLANSPVAKLPVATAETDVEEESFQLLSEEAQHISKANHDELNLELAKAMVSQEPRRVVQVLKQWLNES